MRRVRIGVSGIILPRRTAHTRTLLRALCFAINTLPEASSLEFIFEDDDGTAAGANKVAKQFVTQRVQAVLGPFSSQGILGALSTYSEEKIPVLTPAATVCPDEDVDVLFRLCPNDQAIAGFLTKRIQLRGLQRLLVASDESTHSLRLKDHIQSSLGQALCTSLHEADGLIYTGRLAQSREWLASLRAAGNTLPAFMTDDAASPEVLVGISEPGDYEIVGFKRNAALTGRYAAQFNSSPEIYFEEVVTAVSVLGKASAAGDSMLHTLKTETFDSPVGPLTFINGESDRARCEVWHGSAKQNLELQETTD